jgi:SagB-type dehydrogenase family enzyme
MLNLLSVKSEMNNHNNEIRSATEYHEETKHSELRLRMSRHYLDFDNKPRAFKVYLDLPSISLPQDFPIPAGDALTCIRSMYPLEPGQPLDIRTLAELLFFSAGITRVMKFDSGTYYMRAASATGALYPIELYIISQDIAGLPAGVYHFCPGDFSLTKLRSGDFRRKLAAMAGDNHDILSSPVTIAFTSLAWRNAWKYEDRSYRHWFWDSGVIASNLLAAAVSAGLRPSLVMGFVDSAMNNLLLLEQEKEAAVALAPLNSSRSKTADLPDPEPVPVADIPKILPLSKGEETVYPEIWKLHNASSMTSNEGVIEWLRAEMNNPKLRNVEPKESLHREHAQSLGDVILRRGSSRRFSRSTISYHQLSTILYSSTRGVPLDFKKDQESLVDIYLIANAVEDITPGHYFYNRYTNSLEQLDTMKEITSRNESGYLCLGQSLFSDASAVFFLMADLDTVLEALGNRGYRACEFEAGVVVGKIYLSSYAQGLGASGSTFYDDAVTEAFSPHAKDKAAMIAVGVGIPAYNAHPGKILAARLTKSELLASQ